MAQIDWYEEIEETPYELKVQAKAAAVWRSAGFDASRKEIEECCTLFMITYDQAMIWKDWCIRKRQLTIEKKKRAEEERKKYLEEKRKYLEQRNKDASK